MLDIVASYHCMQFQGKSMTQTQDNVKKPHFRSELGLLGLSSGCHFFKIWLPQLLDIMVNFHHVQYQKKTNDPILTKFSDGRTDGPTRVVS